MRGILLRDVFLLGYSVRRYKITPRLFGVIHSTSGSLFCDAQFDTFELVDTNIFAT